jgi:UPF0271 protein
MQVDINCDLGESFGAYKLGSDGDMMRFITSANIACGYHAGDPTVMDSTVKLALEHGVRVGAHPGYPDLLGFGRRPMAVSPEEVERYVLYQLGALYAVAKARGAELQHLAPHGSLGNTAAVDLGTARAIAAAIAKFSKSIILAAVARSRLGEAGRELGLKVAELVAVDRAYNEDGTLVPRTQPGSVLHDPEVVAHRAVSLIRDGVIPAHNGRLVRMRADTITLHGDNPAAVQNAATLVGALRAAGVQMRAMSDFL